MAFSGDEGPKYFIMATTAAPTRYYQFVGGPTFERVFQGATGDQFMELPGGGGPCRLGALPPRARAHSARVCAGDLKYSQLQFFAGSSGGWANSFSILTGVGVYHGNLAMASQSAGDNVIVEYGLVNYPSAPGGADDGEAPLAMAISEFHYLLLYPTRLVAVSKLSEEPVFERSLVGVSRPRGLSLGGACARAVDDARVNPAGAWRPVRGDGEG